MLTLWARGIPYNYFDLIKDGGLFMFSSSLAASTYVGHMKFSKLLARNEEHNSLLCMLFIVIVCIIGYINSLQFSPKGFEMFPNPTENILQTMALVASIIYGICTEYRLFRLAPKEDI